MDRTGNLAERDYSVASVAETLESLARAAPSLVVKIHCGGDYEDAACIATITLENGRVTVGPPEVDSVGELDENLMLENVRTQLLRQARERALEALPDGPPV
jgi:hypothetical protein